MTAFRRSGGGNGLSAIGPGEIGAIRGGVMSGTWALAVKATLTSRCVLVVRINCGSDFSQTAQSSQSCGVVLGVVDGQEWPQEPHPEWVQAASPGAGCSSDT